jgi:hypothetical protein
MLPVQRLLGLWIAENGKVVFVEGTEKEGELRVTVAPRLDAPPYAPGDNVQVNARCERLLAVYRPMLNDARPARIQVEASENAGHGRLYNLTPVIPATGKLGQHPWDEAPADAPDELLHLVPSTDAGFIDAVTWQDDEGYIYWAEPLLPLRRATEEQLRQWEAAGRGSVRR